MSHSDLKIKRKNENGVLKNLLISLMIGMIAFIGMMTVVSLIILNIAISQEYIYILVLIASGFSSLLGAAFACVFATGKRLITGMGLSVALAIIEFVLLLCFNNISLSNNIYFLLPTVIIFGFLGCLIGSNIKKK